MLIADTKCMATGAELLYYGIHTNQYIYLVLRHISESSREPGSMPSSISLSAAVSATSQRVYIPVARIFNHKLLNVYRQRITL